MLMLDHFFPVYLNQILPFLSLLAQMQNSNATRVVLILLHFQAHGAVLFHAIGGTMQRSMMKMQLSRMQIFHPTLRYREGSS